MSETLDEDTIQSAISTALKKMEDQHKTDLEKLKQEMQKQISAVEAQMKDLAQQVAVQTYQALVTEESPLATKTDHELLKQEINSISIQLSTLIQLVQSGPRHIHASTPPRTSQKRKPTMTPEKLSYGSIHTQDEEVSSATSFYEMEGCEE